MIMVVAYSWGGLWNPPSLSTENKAIFLLSLIYINFNFLMLGTSYFLSVCLLDAQGFLLF